MEEARDCRETQQWGRVVGLTREDNNFYRDIVMKIEKKWIGFKISLEGKTDKIW